MHDNLKASGFRRTPTALLLSIVALALSVISFFSLYANNDVFWAVVCLFVIVPATLLAVVVFTIRDITTRHSWRQTVAVILMFASSAFMMWTATGTRFFFHQLFTFRPVDFHLPENPFVLNQEFTICPQGQSCESRGTATETKVFKLKKIPEDCCSLSVINPIAEGTGVDRFRIVLNGREIELPASNRAPVQLAMVNEISVQLSGAPGSHVYVLIFPTHNKVSTTGQRW